MDKREISEELESLVFHSNRVMKTEKILEKMKKYYNYAEYNSEDDFKREM
jgi:hypothetical protein